MIDISRLLDDMRSLELRLAIQVQTELISLIREFLLREKFVELLPVIISPLTDPLTDFRVRGEVECYGFKYQITKSMIFHKKVNQICLRSCRHKPDQVICQKTRSVYFLIINIAVRLVLPEVF